MKKVKLALDGLQVESFAAGRTPVVHGTVRGNATTLCSPEDTCAVSCLDPNSCLGTCMCTDDPRRC